MKHKWFQGFDWEGLLDKRLQPAIDPKVPVPTYSAKYFDLMYSLLSLWMLLSRRYQKDGSGLDRTR